VVMRMMNSPGVKNATVQQCNNAFLFSEKE